MSLSGPDPQLIAATNFRSVRRSDPNVKAILETSNYSVFYHYDEAGGKWEKQKQEGPLFVVQREKAPEWSLYMLNRQAVKNPAIPLVPGEMKMTVVDQGMLQVARRGEKQRLGIWFSEGHEGVERFRDTILGICGEPSKRPDLPSASASASGNVASPPVVSPQPQVAGNGQSDDGLSRLFAGLIKSPPAQSPLAQPRGSTPQALSAPAPAPAPLARAPSELVFSPEPTNAPSPATAPVQPRESLRPSPPQPSSHTSPPPPPIATISSPPGQTADDLLMSILGLAAPPPLQPPSQPQQQSTSTVHGNTFNNFHPLAPEQVQPQSFPVQHPHLFPPQFQSQHQPQQPQQPQQQRFQPPQFADRPQQSQNEQFLAQPPLQYQQQQQQQQPNLQHPQPHHSGGPPRPPQGLPHFSPQIQAQMAQPHSPLNYRSKVGDATFAQTAASPALSPQREVSSMTPVSERPGQHTPHNMISTPVNGTRPGPEARLTMVDAVVDGLESKERDEGMSVAGIGLSAEQRKTEFRRRLTDLVLTDDRFVDDLWTNYLDRMSRARQGGG